MKYHVIDTAALGEEMTKQQAEDYAKAMATKHPSSTYLIVQSVGRTKHEIGFEWQERINSDTLPEQIKRKIVNQMVKDAENNHTDMDGYRLLDNGELIIAGDELLKSDGITWKLACATVYKSYSAAAHQPHRRKI